MRENRAEQIAELTKLVLEREPGEWRWFLDEACRSDAELRGEIESLLQFEKSALRIPAATRHRTHRSYFSASHVN